MSKNIFNSVQLSKVATNVFNLSHDVKMSFKMGGLYPTCALECLPGDRHTIGTQTMLRFAPLIAPVMHKVNVTTHYFFVPNRILWAGWEKWITGEEDSIHPFLNYQSLEVTEKSLLDYLGYPVGDFTSATSEIRVNPFPISAYLNIWNEYYRDQNLQDAVTYKLIEGNNNGNLNLVDILGIKKRAWQHDYFTSSLPFAQKGDAVQLPLGTVDIEYVAGGNTILRKHSDSLPLVNTAGNQYTNAGGFFARDTGSTQVDIDNSSNLTGTVGSTDINTLRRAFRLQEWLEKNARGGTRYIESILVHFNVRSSDARLNRPEYLGGSKGVMTISEVLSTAYTDGAPVGQMAGHGISVSGGKEFSYSCEEHGWIIGLINVQPNTAYQQGLHKSLQRFDRLEYAWPSFANIGEQEVKNSELYLDATMTEATINATFGYVPRYAEYKYMNSRVSGEMRSSLSFWHLGRIFEGLPALNAEFVQSQPSTRIFAVSGDPAIDTIYGHIFNHIRSVRKLPMYGTPTI